MGEEARRCVAYSNVTDDQSMCSACGYEDVRDGARVEMKISDINGAAGSLDSENCASNVADTSGLYQDMCKPIVNLTEGKTEAREDVSSVTDQVRELTVQEREKLEKDTAVLTEFKQNKLEREAQKNWDLFYKRNTTKFFKDRHWTRREFGELVNKKADEPLVVFEVGCGVGNFMFPLMQEDQNIHFYACDFSKRAVQFVKDDTRFESERCTVFHCDITEDDLSNQIPSPCVDVATMIFVLSAVHPDKMVTSVRKIFNVLKPGGCLLIRDYGLYDYAMLRFAPGHKLNDNFYVRQDGTRAYYFALDILKKVMSQAGFVEDSCMFVQRQTINRKEGLSVPRIFIQGKFVKPNT